MTDNTQDPGTTPDQPQDGAPFEVNSSGEAAAQPTAAQPTVPRAADNQSTEVLGSGDAPVAAPAPTAAEQQAAAQQAAAQQPPEPPASLSPQPA